MVLFRFGVMGMALALLSAAPASREMQAAVTVTYQNRSITLNRSTDFGVSSAGGVAIGQVRMYAVEIDPLGTFSGSVNVPVSQIGDNATDTVADDGTVTKALASSSTTYAWRGNCATSGERNTMLSSVQDIYVFSESLGSMMGNLSLVGNTAQKLKVTLVKSTMANSGNTVWRNLNLIMDLNNVRYSGTYRSTLNSTVTCPGLTVN